MQTLNAQQAADLLHLNVKRVQGMARTGRLPAARVGRKWLFHREQLERMLRREPAHSAAGGIEISARNHLRGVVTELRVDGLMAEVHLRIGEQELVSIITRASAERLGLAAGVEALAIVKSTEVIIGREGMPS